MIEVGEEGFSGEIELRASPSIILSKPEFIELRNEQNFRSKFNKF